MRNGEANGIIGIVKKYLALHSLIIHQHPQYSFIHSFFNAKSRKIGLRRNIWLMTVFRVQAKKKVELAF
jgi:hypothetical protein